jgi:hypothetical protein
MVEGIVSEVGLRISLALVLIMALLVFGLWIGLLEVSLSRQSFQPVFRWHVLCFDVSIDSRSGIYF